MSVLLPSSTEPIAAIRRTSISEVPKALAVLHRGVRVGIVHARRAPLAAPGLGELRDDRGGIRGARPHGGRARHVADRAEPDALARYRSGRGDERVDRNEHSRRLEDVALVAEVDLRKVEVLALDVLPHV